MIDLSNIKNYYIACGYTDLRRGIDGLAQIVTLQYGYEIDENSLFLFCGRRTDRIKALWFSGDGFVLLYKRLNNGSFQWPRSKIADAAELSVADGGLGDRAEKGHKKVPPKGYVLAKKWLKHWTFRHFCGIINTVKTTEKGGA